MLPAQQLSVHWLDSRPGLRDPLVSPGHSWPSQLILSSSVWHAGCMTCRLYDLQTTCSVDCLACRLYDKIVVNFDILVHIGHRKSLFGHYISQRPIAIKNLLLRPFYKINRSASRLAKKRSIHATGTKGSTQSSSLSILKSSNKLWV